MSDKFVAISISVDLHRELMKAAGRLQADTGKRVSVGDVVQDLYDRAKAPARKP